MNPEWQAKSANEKAAMVWHGAQGLAEDVYYYGKRMREEAERRIGHLYPTVKITTEIATVRPDLKEYLGQELTVIAWLWARTVVSPDPTATGAHVPLVRSFWLGTKPGKEAWIRPVIDRDTNTYSFDLGVGNPRPTYDPGVGTVNRKGGKCLLTGSPMPFPHIREEGKARRMQQRLMAIATEGNRGRVYVAPIELHESVALSARPTWKPLGEMPKKHRNFQPPVYGMNEYGDIFTPRQLVALTTFCELINDVRTSVLQDAITKSTGSNDNDSQTLADRGGRGPAAYADAVVTYLALAIDRLANYASTLCTWHSGVKYETLTSTFGRQALPMTWDFAEGNPFSASSGNFDAQVAGVTANLKNLLVAPQSLAKATQLDAAAALTDESVLVSTDPPYYDNIEYSELSDFFYLWLRKSLGAVYPTLFSTLLTPKVQELVAAPHRFDGDRGQARQFFEKGLGSAFRQMAKVQVPQIPLTLFYAFKQTETDEASGAEEGANDFDQPSSTGWETMLEGLIQAGFETTGTWPMRTELIGNLKKNISALASSVVLVCRPRPATAPLATRKEFISALRGELPLALRNLQHGNIAPVDLAQAAIGPGMGVFTRYAKVVESDGSPMTVRTALGIINQVLDEVLAEQEGDFDADTRWALAWFEQFGTKEEAFGVAETLSRAKNTAVNGLVEAGVIKAKSGKVQLVSRAELPDNWDPAADRRLTAWETVQHLIRTLETKGEAEAAQLLKRLGGVGETARDLAYRLYSICERKKWAEEALAYNSLVIAWPELSKLARSTTKKPAAQAEMF
ncbi:MAG TPA: hypothetical protein VHD85_21525 [Terracidiphilus sp.]|nr:hypothetical protein [Terracidiphilus sp.]